ncbi:disks large-associated protein 5 isoform X1 [Silurus asotus]|uniref:Disks large-associated protein 5 isoform X1 n=1 Tax=Silurus asotus TaxID=30991 RepID=A0AAD5AUB9_SILAS|nr:disks large-associated protein 5 isoform X1 [Silurus asotus]
MLARFKENKALQKEKEKREKEKKGIFKVGLYRPQPLGYLPLNSVIPSAKKPVEKQPATKKAEPPSTRANKSSAPGNARGRIAPVEPVVRAPTTRSAAKNVTADVTNKSVAKPAADLRPLKTNSTNRKPAAPSIAREKTVQGHTESMAAEKRKTKVADEVVAALNPSSLKEEKIVEKAKVTPDSFAPQGFVFQPPSGLRTFEPTPLSPRSADAFLSPSFLDEPRTVFTSSIPPTNPSSAPLLSSPPPCMSEMSPASNSALPTLLPASGVSLPAPYSQSPHASPSTPPSISLPPSSTPSEPQHDVSYFRAVITRETDRLTGLSELWQVRFDDLSIPEEMRDRMRTAVGQARLLMKERFGQFSGLVDDCDFGRGEKITTCTDLQGFWDMVYFQVEDVDKKFNALKEAEARGWEEEKKPVTRQKKVVKKPPAAGGKAGAGQGAVTAAKSRLAAVKAAMKAKQAEVAKAAETSDRAQDGTTPASDAVANNLTAQTVVFHGGFFQVESPVKVIGTSPNNYFGCTTVSSVSTPKQADPLSCSPKPPNISPEQHRSALHASSNEVSGTQLGQPDHKNIQLDLMITPIDDQINQSAEIKPHNSPGQSKKTPLQLPSDTDSSMEPEESTQESAITALPQEQTEETVFTEGDMFNSDTQAHEICVSAPSSPCMMSTTPQQANVLNPAPSDKTEMCISESSPISEDHNVAENQDSESNDGLDFERYLQPAARCSLSPVQTMAVDRFSLGLEDAEMESPQAQAEEPVQDAPITPTGILGAYTTGLFTWCFVEVD